MADQSERQPNQPTPSSDDISRVADAGSSIFNIITGALTQLQSGQTRIEQAMAGQTARMDKLVDTTNHRLDEYREDMERRATEDEARRSAYESAVATMIAGKANRAELVTDVFRKNRAVQVAVGAIVLTLAPVVADHWRMLFERLQNLPFV